MNKLNRSIVKIALLLVFVNGILSVPSESVQWPEECEGRDLCDVKLDVSQEIQDEMAALMKKFNMKNLGNSTWTSPEPEDRIANDHPSRCETKEWEDTPFAAFQNKKIYAVFQSEFFQQKIRYRKCKHVGSRCYEDAVTAQSSVCEQIQAPVQLYVYDFDTRKMQLLIKHIPSCCKCKVDC